MNSQGTDLDLRVRRTRKLLWEALLGLINEKDFESITIKELCERAMVHRTTFYSHYLDKYDLLEQGMSTMYDELVALAPPAQDAPAQFSWETPPENLIAIYDHIAENQHFYGRMLVNPGVSAFHQLLRNYFRDYVRVRLQGARPANPEVPPQVVLHFTVGAILELVTWWLEAGFPHTARQMALYTVRLIAYGVYPALGIEGPSTIQHQHKQRSNTQ